MANVRDVVQTVIDGLDVFRGILPDGNWQQVAAHLAVPEQQQLMQQQMQQQLQQAVQQAVQPIAQMQQQLQQAVQQAVQPIAQMLQQLQLTLQQMQATQAQMQEDFTAMRWNQANSAIRFRNRKNRGTILLPLHKECEGGNSPVGALPPAQMHFPQNRAQADALTANRLNQLQEFYQVQFAGALVTDRRCAFSVYVSEPAEM